VGGLPPWVLLRHSSRRQAPSRGEETMFDPVPIPMADILGSLSSVANVILVAAVGLLLFELTVVLGVLIANLSRRSRAEGAGEVRLP